MYIYIYIMSVSPSEFFYTDVSYVDTSNALINFSNLTGNAELNEHPLSKYARGIFFSPNYNKQFFDAINWANNLGDYKTQLNLINPFNNSILENLQFDSTIVFTGGIFENGFDKNYTSNVDDIFNPFDLNEPGTISPPVYNYNGNFNNANIFSVSNSSLNEWNGWQPDKDWAISFIVKAPTTNTSCHLMHFGDSNNNNKYATVIWDFYNTNNPDTMRWGVSWTSDSNTGRVDANHLGVVVYPYNLPSNTAYFQLLITYDKRDYTPNGDPNKTGPRIRYKENGRDSDYGLAIFWRGSNDITMFNSEHSNLPWDLSGFPENIQSGHTWYATIKENETFNWTQTMTATIGGGPTGIVTHPDHGRHSNRGNIDESGYITDIKFWNTNIDPINQSQYIYSPPPNAIITANDNPTSGPNAGTQVPISLNTDNIEFRNAIAGNTIVPINNVLNIESPFNKYFGVIPTADSHNGQFALYIFSLIQDGVTVFELRPYQETGTTWDTSTPGTGFHQGGWGFQVKTSPYINNNTLWFYVEVPSNYQFTNAQLSINLMTYDGNHIPASGKFVTASQPTGPWIEIGNWSLSLPLPSVNPANQGGGYSISSILDNGWQQLGSDIISWKTPGTYYMRYKATDYDGVETPNNDEHYLTVTVNQGPIIYQSWKISDVTSNSIIRPNNLYLPQKDVYVKVTPVNAGNKFRLRFQGSTSGRYQLKDIRIAKMNISGTQPQTFGPWYTISINGTSGQTFFEFPQSDHQWTDWIDAPIEANTPYLVYFKYHHSRDWYTYWTTSTTNSWVNGTGENRVYNIDLMEVEN